MSTPTRVLAFVAGLAAIFGLAFGVGRAADRGSTDRSSSTDPGYVLRLQHARVDPGHRTLRFVIEDGSGRALNQFAVRHEKELHLVAVNDDFGGFQHVHPVMAPDGTWSADLDLTAGIWRVYADFQPSGGENTVASADLEVTGTAHESADVSFLRTSSVDGYTVTALGDPVPGRAVPMTFEISRNGQPVADLQRYLGAYGHLVVLRASDGKYIHVHPEAGPAGPRIEFETELPSASVYHLYLDFRHGGVVRTAHFAIDAGTPPTGPMEDADHGGGDGHGDH